MINMVQFKSWRDFYIFLKDYARCSCLNCEYGGDRIDLNEEHNNVTYRNVFCTRTISMVNLELMTVCAEYIHQESKKTLKDFEDESWWTLPDDVIDEIEKGGKWGIVEINELVRNYECE